MTELATNKKKETLTLEQFVESQQLIREDPVYFVEEYAQNKPWTRQKDILRSVFKNKITTVRSCHGIGKSWLSAKAALAFLTAYDDSYVITTAPTFRQVENILWRDIRSTYKKTRWPLGGRIFESPRLDMDDEWFAIGLSTKDPDMFQGFHPPSGHILVIVDEASGVTDDIFIAIDSVLSSQGARLLMIGNPTSITGRFYTSHHNDATSTKFHISCFDTPNFTNNGIRTIEDLQEADLSKAEILAPYLVTPEWVKDKITRWGIESPMFQARCLGNFPSAEANTLIPLNYIEAACTEERKEELEAKQSSETVYRYVGVDPARYGDDKSAFVEREGQIVDNIFTTAKEDNGQTAGHVKLMKAAHTIFVDAGMGAGVIDILRSDKYDNVIEVAGSASPFKDDTSLQFVNLRAQMYWRLAELFKTGQIYIPEDSELMSQLASIRYKVTRRGIQIEEKDEIKKRLKVSPDKADALAYCFCDFMTSRQELKPTLGKSFEEMYNEGIGI